MNFDEIRRATKSDTHEIVAIYKEQFGEAHHVAINATDILLSKAVGVYVGTVSDTVIGTYAILDFLCHDAYCLSRICVHPNYKRNGLGRQLVNHFLETSARETAHSHAYSSTTESNPDSIAFHKAVGFEHAGCVDDLCGGEKEILFKFPLDNIRRRLWKDLHGF